MILESSRNGGQIFPLKKLSWLRKEYQNDESYDDVIKEVIHFVYFSGADLAALVREASICALKEAILNKGKQPSNAITVRGEHFDAAFKKVKPSVTLKVTSPSYLPCDKLKGFCSEMCTLSSTRIYLVQLIEKS